MGWMIGRAAAMADPEQARKKALAKLQGLADLDDPENLVVPILIDALLMVEAYRGARHQFTFLPELTGSVDALLRPFTTPPERSANLAARRRLLKRNLGVMVGLSR